MLETVVENQDFRAKIRDCPTAGAEAVSVADDGRDASQLFCQQGRLISCLALTGENTYPVGNQDSVTRVFTPVATRQDAHASTSGGHGAGEILNQGRLACAAGGDVSHADNGNVEL